MSLLPGHVWLQQQDGTMGELDVAPLRVMAFSNVGVDSMRCRQHLTPLVNRCRSQVAECVWQCALTFDPNFKMAVDLCNSFLPLPSLLFFHGCIVVCKLQELKVPYLILALVLFFSSVASHVNDMKWRVGQGGSNQYLTGCVFIDLEKISEVPFCDITNSQFPKSVWVLLISSEFTDRPGDSSLLLDNFAKVNCCMLNA